MIKVDHLRIGLCYTLSTPRTRIVIDQIWPFWKKITDTIEFLENKRDKSCVEVSINLSSHSPFQLVIFAHRFEEDYHFHSGGLIHDNGPNVATITVFVPAKDGTFHVFPDMLKNEERIQYEARRKAAKEQAMQAMSTLLIELFQKIGMPDFFEDGQNFEDVIIEIYPEIKKLGKEIHGNSPYLVFDEGKCSYPFDKSRKYLKEQEEKVSK